MKKAIFFIIFFTLNNLNLSSCFAYQNYVFHPKGTLEFSIDRNHEIMTLTGFRFESANIYAIEGSQTIHLGTVEKSYGLTRCYTFKIGDETIATHRSLFFSYGTLDNSLKEYLIFNGENNIIGFIKGIFYTEATAEFFFYDQEGLFAKAILDKSRSELTICNSNNEPLLICKKTLTAQTAYSYSAFHKKNEYFWSVKKEKDVSFNAHFFWPFLGFVSEIWAI